MIKNNLIKGLMNNFLQVPPKNDFIKTGSLTEIGSIESLEDSTVSFFGGSTTEETALNAFNSWKEKLSNWTSNTEDLSLTNLNSNFSIIFTENSKNLVNLKIKKDDFSTSLVINEKSILINTPSTLLIKSLNSYKIIILCEQEDNNWACLADFQMDGAGGGSYIGYYKSNEGYYHFQQGVAKQALTIPQSETESIRLIKKVDDNKIFKNLYIVSHIVLSSTSERELSNLWLIDNEYYYTIFVGLAQDEDYNRVSANIDNSEAFCFFAIKKT